ncbi:ADP-ribosylglycohydrolase family protein [Desulfocicer niacini]
MSKPFAKKFPQFPHVLVRKGKKKGAFTHYGDQMFLLLESLSNGSGFDLDDFAAQWQAMFEGYNGYVDNATKKTLANFKNGRSPDSTGSESTDLGGASRMVPLALYYGNDTETIRHGVENIPQAFLDLFEGKNKGKMVVKL